MTALRKVLIANRGEIAVRIARACRAAGLASVAVYADPDRDGLHVRVADEAIALGGSTPRASYLDPGRVLRAARDCGADSVHPGYGYLSEDAGFAQAVQDAGLTWIGPPPDAIRVLSDKVAARRLARQVGAPVAAGTTTPLSGAAEAAAFAREHGFPVVIKAASGGGGKSLAVAWSEAEIPAQYDAVVRAAVAESGRAECFAERYLDRPRHVETQCLADAHGHVVVVSTRDCSSQRRHQKMIEEAPAPLLSDAQDAGLRAASKAILRAAGYVSAGTCEFLLGGDGSLCFLEVNPRLSMAHPVSEEVTGIDLVGEMFRIARGEELGYDDPEIRGHAIQFRVYAEDPRHGFRRAGGVVRSWSPPSGPGIRVDSGVEAGSVIYPEFGSLLAKLVVSGASRVEAIEAARRSLAAFDVAGLPTGLQFLAWVVTQEAFAPADASRPFGVHTRWLETLRT